MSQINNEAGSVFPNETPATVTERGSDTRYSRQERRKKAFVILNENNGKFIKHQIEQKGARKVLRFYDVELEEATTYAFKDIAEIMGYVNRQNITYKLCYLDAKGNRQVR